MKRVLILITLVLAMYGNSVWAREYYVALSPYESTDTVQQQTQSLLQWAVQLDAGDKVSFVDGYNLNVLGRFNVPESETYKSPRARLNANREAVAKVLQFAQSAALPAGENEPAVRGAILLPQLLRQIALMPSGSGDRDVIVMASPVYDHPAQPQWSMTGGRFPGDGNIFASRSRSPYAAADTPTLLDGFRVHIAYDESVGEMEIDEYAFRVQRYFTLFIEAQGGQLVSFTTDPGIALERAQFNAPAIPHQFEAQEVERGQASIYERPVAQKRFSRAELRHAEKASIGLTWACSTCDLDLYSRAHSNAETLYYDNPETREGVVRKVFPLAYQEQGNKGFETIYYTSAVNFEEMLIAVNFYEGSAPSGVEAELRIDIAGHTYAHSIHIAASEGNRGVDALMAIEESASTAPQTLLIDPLDVIAHD